MAPQHDLLHSFLFASAIFVPSSLPLTLTLFYDPDPFVNHPLIYLSTGALPIFGYQFFTWCTFPDLSTRAGELHLCHAATILILFPPFTGRRILAFLPVWAIPLCFVFALCSVTAFARRVGNQLGWARVAAALHEEKTYEKKWERVRGEGKGVGEGEGKENQISSQQDLI